MRGELILIKTPVEIGRDEHNNPVYSMETESLDNVLVAPQEAEVLGGSTRPEGMYVKYTLYFPKVYTGDLEKALVCVRGQWLEVIGDPDIWDPCPTDWNRVVYVGGTHG